MPIFSIKSPLRVASVLKCCFNSAGEERITSPIILSYRINDSSWYIDTIKELGKALYAEHAQH